MKYKSNKDKFNGHLNFHFYLRQNPQKKIV